MEIRLRPREKRKKSGLFAKPVLDFGSRSIDIRWCPLYIATWALDDTPSQSAQPLVTSNTRPTRHDGVWELKKEDEYAIVAQLPRSVWKIGERQWSWEQ